MSRPLLNCATPESALNSLAVILGMAAADLLALLQSITLTGHESQEDLEHLLHDYVIESRQVPDFNVIWFHGSRLLRAHTLTSEGLLPGHMMEARLRAHLEALCSGLERCGSNRFALSRATKPKVEGPFAMLCRDAAATPSGINGHYLDHPELIDDIAGELLGENYLALTERFEQMSAPCVVHFVGRPIETVLPRALLYVYESLIEKRDAIEVANSVLTYFDGKGVPVSPEKILKIEWINGTGIGEMP